MSFLSNIKDKIFSDSTEDITVEVVEEAFETDVTISTQSESEPVDVAANLDAMNARHAEDLSWRTSIVDLLKLTGEDSSYGARKELAAELGIEGYGGSAEDNIALNKAVLVNLSENGGTVPADLIV